MSEFKYKELQIAGQKIKIETNNNLDREDILARITGSQNLIEVCTNYKGAELPIENIEQSLWHEVVHGILDKMGEYDLSSNEKFVQTFSLLIHQAIKTLK